MVACKFYESNNLFNDFTRLLKGTKQPDTKMAIINTGFGACPRVFNQVHQIFLIWLNKIKILTKCLIESLLLLIPVLSIVDTLPITKKTYEKNIFKSINYFNNYFLQ